MEIINLKSLDNYDLELHVFEIENFKGVIQIIHGMEEHQERYEPLIKVLNNYGYSVVSSNMRGHGKNAPTLGFFKEKAGYKYLLADQKTITEYIKNRFKVNKVILLCHSMGTIIARNLMQSESFNYEKIILSGFPCKQKGVSLGIMLANIIQFFKGPNYYSKMLENIAVGNFNKDIKNAKTDFDWLSYNESNVQDYINDPYCGHGFKVSALNDLFHLVKNMGKIKDYHNVNQNVPILMLSGEDDPCTGYEKGRKDSILTLKNAGFASIQEICYKQKRHEILNEEGKEQIYQDILNFLS